MPSGAKKRKAAKKKMENQSNNNPNRSSASTQTHGDGDDVKHQDDKESDVGEVDSPASQDRHRRHNTFSGGEEEIEGEKIEVIDEPRRIAVEESFIPVEREFKNGDESDKKDGKSEHDEIATKSYDGDSSRSSSSSSSSDDESHEIKNSQAENIVAVVPVNISLFGEKAEEDISSQANNSVAPSIQGSELKENGDNKLSSVGDKVGISEAFEDVAPQREEATTRSVENIAAISDTTESVAQETDDRLSLSYNAPIASSDNGADHEKDSGVSEPLLAPAPHPEQTTSWKSCCGLFDVFTGSGR